MRDAPDAAAPLDGLDIVEGLYLAEVVTFLHGAGLLADLSSGLRVAEVAAARDYDVELLRLVIEYAAHRSGLLEPQTDDRWAVAPEALGPAFAHTIEMYIDGYGGCVRRLPQQLREPNPRRQGRDNSALARAWSRLDEPGFPAAAELLRLLGARTVADLGCGNGSLLVSLANAEPSFQGIGLEVDAGMCEEAQRRIDAEGLSGRITIIEGSVLDVAGLVPDGEREKVDAVYCGSLLNAFFAPRDGGRAVDVLTRIAVAFPGRPLIVADYYGRLGHGVPSPSEGRTLVHDLAQALSGQGVPAPDLAGWKELYAAAGEELIHAGSGHDRGVNWFIHVVRLPGEPTFPRV